MAFLNYKKDKSVSFQGTDVDAMPVSMAQYILHYIYGANEPKILKLGGTAMSAYERTENPRVKEMLKEFMRTTQNTSKSGNYFLPHGIVLSRKAAENVVDFIYAVETRLGAHISGWAMYLRSCVEALPRGRHRA